MKILFIFFFLCISNLILKGQGSHFIYFQTENKQPFYIKLNNKILSSSPGGYLILSKLKDDNYKITFGFPNSEMQEKEIDYKVDKKDAGYIIKNFGEKGWGLFNLQTFDVLMPGNVTDNKNKVTQQNQDDAFSTMLATVVDDSTIRKKDLAQNDVINNKDQILAKADTLKKIDVADSVALSNPRINNSDSEVTSSSIINRILKSKSKDGLELIYTDKSATQIDTIRVFLAIKNMAIKQKLPDTQKNDVVYNTIKDSAKDSLSSHVESKQIKTVVDTSGKESVLIKIDSSKDEKKALSPIRNSDCKAFASEEDFIKLRKKMAAENNDDDMIRIAKKTFKSRCFTTEYIKNLSTLFLKDIGKYGFFDAAYPFVSDSNIFPTLENQLTDPYYISRFKVMIHH